MTDILTNRTDLLREVRKPGKVYVTMLVRSDVHRIAVEKLDLIHFLQDEPEDCSVMGFRQDDGTLIIDAA